jgi:DeoR family transcriptional regulator of aga operon
MKRAERLSAVLELLAQSGEVEIDQLVGRLSVSPATARRDLDALAERQLLNRTRGGAVSSSVVYDLPTRYTKQQHPEAKAAIARAASAMVPRGAVVGLCGGTTSTAIADALMSRADIMEPSHEPGLTVVTNAVNIAMQLAMRPQIKTVITGGVVNARSYELVGSYADAVLGNVALDLAFIGVNALDPAFGPTSHDEREAMVDALMASRAAHPVIVADASKLDKRAFAAIGGTGLFPTVITDSSITSDQRERLVENGYEVIVAPPA